MASELIPGMVYVCAIRDIECGNRSANWCDTCPKRRATPPSAAEVELPPMPAPVSGRWKGARLAEYSESYTADQMRAYGQACARAALAAKESERAGWVRTADRRPRDGEKVIVAIQTNYTNAPPLVQLSPAIYRYGNWIEGGGHHLQQPVYCTPFPAAPAPTKEKS